MSDQNENHSYDGIVEENNRMPTWWVWLFIGTIIFSGIYYIHYQVGGGQTLKEEFNLAMAEVKALQDNAPFGVGVTNEMIALIEKNPEALIQAQKVYTEKCAMCHGPDLGGKIGPNLTDAYWLNGQGSHKDIFAMIAEGKAEKGMPPWKAILKEEEIKALAAYVHSKKGSKATEPKAPEGVLVEN